MPRCFIEKLRFSGADAGSAPGFPERLMGGPKPRARFLTCDQDRFCTFSTALGGGKGKVGLTHTITRLILDKTVMTCGLGGGGRAFQEALRGLYSKSNAL